MTSPCVGLLVLILVAAPAGAKGQYERYELGQRLRRFETEWERRTDPADRKRALQVLRPATTQFLTFRLSAAARTLDEAANALQSARKSSPDQQFADSLSFTPSVWLIDAKENEIELTIRTLYETDGRSQTPFTLKIVSDGKELPQVVDSLPARIRVPLTGEVGNDPIACRILIRHPDTAMQRTLTITRVKNLAGRLQELKASVVPEAGENALEQATVRETVSRLTAWQSGEVPEYDPPIGALLQAAEQMTAANAKPFFRCDRPGDFSLAIPHRDGTATPCRVLIPPKLTADAPVPVVVALHGAGGSENLYFEGYGAGCVAKACADRGWLLLCPRAGLGFLGGPPRVAEMIEALAERYPIDRDCVFLVGHSMGAAQTVDLVQKHPDRFAGIAVLGGGGRVRKPESFRELPTFIGIGAADFARSGAVSLRKALTDAGATRLTFREYPDIEHLVIVRAAVEDAFAEFDRIARQSR